MQVRVMSTESLLAGDATPLRTLEFGSSVPEGFTFSRDNKYLFGSAYYTGVSNIYRYEIVPGEIQAVSNAETGFFRPVPISDTELVVFNYTARGFVPAMIRPPYPRLTASPPCFMASGRRMTFRAVCRVRSTSPATATSGSAPPSPTT